MSYDWRESPENYVDLLFVQDGPNRQVVEVPAYQAEVGDLVEYTAPEDEEPVGGFAETVVSTRLGLVLKKMRCERFGNEWSCISEVAQIRRGKAAYHPGWSRNEDEL